MKTFHCVCGQTLFFENTFCTSCSRKLGYDPVRQSLVAIEPKVDGAGTPGGIWSAVGEHTQYRLCSNELNYQLCNWLVSHEGDDYCLACSLNQVVPTLEQGPNSDRRRMLWEHTEQAKRRLVYSLLALGLPVETKAQNPNLGLAFAFLEDRKENPNVKEDQVFTGHYQGLITVNLAEADHATRIRVRQDMGESYRTMLGHFRHESGHYYFDRLLANSPRIESFRSLFGDERRDYKTALEEYYAKPMPSADGMISAYASSHPLEDWAECWAHYLHFTDTLETAANYGVAQGVDLYTGRPWDIEQGFEQWGRVSVMLNSLNRSMGLEDAYPFVLSPETFSKLRFVHQTIYPSQRPTQTAASV
ncbi:MAG: putative zinc-binding metallopeptidase [Pseudohongiellaceae bacterium]|nr:putative zinc-binding metallopeptidase [Pseudohongiellaceae bacterium]